MFSHEYTEATNNGISGHGRLADSWKACGVKTMSLRETNKNIRQRSDNVRVLTHFHLHMHMHFEEIVHDGTRF